MMQSHAVSQQHNALLSQAPGGPSYQVNKLTKPWHVVVARPLGVGGRVLMGPLAGVRLAGRWAGPSSPTGRTRR
jgi:hypothetical protein